MNSRNGFEISQEYESGIIPSLKVTWKDDNGDWWETLEINNEIVGHRRLPKFKEDERSKEIPTK